MKRILGVVETEYGLAPGSLTGGRRTPGIIRGRELTCFAMLEFLRLPIMDVAGILGRSRTFVRVASERMAKRIETGDPIAENVLKKLKRIIGLE